MLFKVEINSWTISAFHIVAKAKHWRYWDYPWTETTLCTWNQRPSFQLGNHIKRGISPQKSTQCIPLGCTALPSSTAAHLLQEIKMRKTQKTSQNRWKLDKYINNTCISCYITTACIRTQKCFFFFVHILISIVDAEWKAELPSGNPFYLTGYIRALCMHMLQRDTFQSRNPPFAKHKSQPPGPQRNL